ncbi:hypothetical protein [Nitratireductor basaltis]|uniref:Uncharacterized protein n=1 Tax=Nitratireductor basaltis TaxID=472175 RepID=A0A084U5X4_9HYPH|nr:hypothetical protein [Nitratireductor basaltis]KFB08360.1 hypothetical protein EL18_02610 [Nitratireductor basaltis]
MPLAPTALLMMRRGLVAALLYAGLAATPVIAQGLDSEEAIDAIVGSEVKTEQATTVEETDRLIQAVGAARPAAEEVRKTFNLDELDIIFISPDTAETPEVAEVLAENEQALQTLREAIEGSALFYHAVDSRSILLRDIVAVEYGEESRVTVFVIGEAPEEE